MPITTVTYECGVPDVAQVEHLVLQVVATLTDATLGPITTTVTLGMTQTMHNAFTRARHVASAVGLCGSVRLLAHTIANDDQFYTHQDECWIQAAEQTLLSYLAQQSHAEGASQAAVLEFWEQIETHLIAHSQTYLVGSAHASVADVVLGLIVAHVATVGNLALPPQTHRWCRTVLHQLHDLVHFRTIPGWITHGLVPLNRIAPWLTTLPEGDDVSGISILAAAIPKPVPTAPAVASVPVPAPSEPAPVPPKAPTPVPTTTLTATIADASGNAILEKLTEFALEHEVYDHKASSTAEELVANVPLPDTESHTKNLFLKDKKHGLFLVTVRPNAQVNTKELGKALKLEGKTNLRLADAAILDQVLHVKPGCVGPLCMALTNPDDLENKVTLVLDQDLLSQYSHVHSHPLRNDQSVKLTPDALKSYLDQAKVTYVTLEFPAAADGAAPTGKAPANRPPATKTEKAPKAKPAATATKSAAAHEKKGGKKGETLLALQWKKSENFPAWYSDVIVLSEMISYYDISGCYILRPWSYKMWELIQVWFNAKIEDMGVENAYFPLFVSQDRLEKEKDHVEGFAPEVAWVTRSGEGDLARPIAVRPTSETIMYPAYSDWIKSHRDLPLKLNQWSNVVRWEFKYPTPFLRTREFLWQEGHTAHATFEDADATVMEALELYRGVYEDLLAVPVVPGYKTEKEKFAGGFRTTTVEAYIAGSGRAIQGATSHNLGQNFGKMFEISFQNEKGESQIPWQTSWGLTTRTIGVMVMVHGDDTGLVLPPRVAPLQVVIVPIISKKLTPEQADPYCLSILADLKKAGLRAKYDDRSAYNPGWKYNHWEQKGVPVRIEVGPRDIEQKSARVVVRHNSDKEDHPVEGLGSLLRNMMDVIHDAMFTKAKDARDAHVVQVTDWKDFVPNLEKNNLVLTPWCGGEHQEWEETVKEKSRAESLLARGEEVEDEKTATSVAAKTLCIPFAQPELPAGTKCIASGMEATCWVLWGRSY